RFRSLFLLTSSCSKSERDAAPYEPDDYEPMPMGPEADALRLRRALRDLVALSTVPAAWVGREPPAIAAGLADVLVNSLHLDFAFVRLCDHSGSLVVRGHGRAEVTATGPRSEIGLA